MPEPAYPGLAELVVGGQAELGTTRLVAIDGPAGSGKTTLAEGLNRELTGLGFDVAVLHLDDLYAGWTGLDDALGDRVLAQVLQPLSRGEPARWQRYDWHRGCFGSWKLLAPPAVLVLEGCGSGALTYAPYTTLLVWLEATRDTRIARGVERDGAQVLDHWLAWMELEDAHFAANDTRNRADLVRVSD
ncbi:MAG: AAA family ATPase [Propionibacteriales bacterium]|nr:AAA family ATPase [Propionibacteriales bacterium]